MVRPPPESTTRMSLHFNRQIEKLKRLILSLGDLVQDAVDDSIQAVQDRDKELARSVINRDSKIDDMEIEVEEECLHTLALHQPVAFDLRYVVAVLKINNDLERIADLASNIGEQAIFISGGQWIPDLPFDLGAMARSVKTMLRDALTALVNIDNILAKKVLRSDDDVDRIHAGVYDQVYELIRATPAQVEQYIHFLTISRQLERIADHAVNIAEDVLYMSEGKIFRHQGQVSNSDKAQPSAV